MNCWPLHINGKAHGSCEFITVQSPHIFCTIRTHNVAFSKRVFVRVTHDRWASFRDVFAEQHGGREPYPGAPDASSDRFFASISAPGYTLQTLQFAICMEAAGTTFWDNNGGLNYTVIAQER